MSLDPNEIPWPVCVAGAVLALAIHAADWLKERILTRHQPQPNNGKEARVN